MKEKIAVVGFLSRPHGFDVLKMLVSSQDFIVKKLYTHSLKTKEGVGFIFQH